MTYITYTPIDRQFKTLEKDLPPGVPFNGIDPIPGITFGFALQSRYPLPAKTADIRFGTITGAVPDNPGILLRSISKAEYDTAYETEMAARIVVPVAESLPDISDRQFFQALASPPYSFITTQEALDAVKTGEIPPVMQDVIDALPTDQQFGATMLIAGATTFRRNNTLVKVFAASKGMTEADVDTFWRFAGSL